MTGPVGGPKALKKKQQEGREAPQGITKAKQNREKNKPGERIQSGSNSRKAQTPGSRKEPGMAGDPVRRMPAALPNEAHKPRGNPPSRGIGEEPTNE